MANYLAENKTENSPLEDEAYAIEKISNNISIIQSIKNGDYNNDPLRGVHDVVIAISEVASVFNPAYGVLSESLTLIKELVTIFQANNDEYISADDMIFLSLMNISFNENKLYDSAGRLKALRNKIQSNIEALAIKHESATKALQKLSNMEMNNVASTDSSIIKQQLNIVKSKSTEFQKKEWLAVTKIVYDFYIQVENDLTAHLAAISQNILKDSANTKKETAGITVQQISKFLQVLQFRYAMYTIVGLMAGEGNLDPQCTIESKESIMKQLKTSTIQFLEPLRFLTHPLIKNRVIVSGFFGSEYSSIMIHWMQTFDLKMKFMNPELDVMQLQSTFKIYPMYWESKYFLSVKRTQTKNVTNYRVYCHGDSRLRLQRIGNDSDPTGFGCYYINFGTDENDYLSHNGNNTNFLDGVGANPAEFVIFKAFESDNDDDGFYYLSKRGEPSCFYYMSKGGWGIVGQGIYVCDGNPGKQGQWKALRA